MFFDDLRLEAAVAIPRSFNHHLPKLAFERLGGCPIARVAAVVSGRVVLLERRLADSRTAQEDANFRRPSASRYLNRHAPFPPTGPAALSCDSFIEWRIFLPGREFGRDHPQRVCGRDARRLLLRIAQWAEVLHALA